MYDRMHYVYQILAHFSIPHFAFEAALLIIYGNGRCGEREVQVLLHAMSLTDEYLYSCFAMLTVNLVLYRVVAIWLMVKRVNPPEDRRMRMGVHASDTSTRLNL